jgi:hypothetical protein
MDMIKYFAPLPLFLLVACGGPAQPAAAPAPIDDAVPAVALEPPPVYALIGHREALNLDSEQVMALDSIGQHVHAANQAQMRAVGDLRQEFRTPSGRDARPGEIVPATDRGRELLATIRRNNVEAAEGVRNLLSEEQRVRTCEIFRDRERERAQRADAARRAPARGAAPRTDRAAMQPIWPWCGPDDAVANGGTRGA